MTLTARLLTLLAVFFLANACSHVAPPVDAPASATTRDPAQRSPLTATAPAPSSASSTALQPSPNRLVGRVLAIDAPRGFAFVELTTAPPAGALVAGAELLTRTDDLRETARLRASRYSRGRTLATTILSGQPSPGDEVVFRAP